VLLVLPSPETGRSTISRCPGMLEILASYILSARASNQELVNQGLCNRWGAARG
jgi:hypothetical protein